MIFAEIGDKYESSGKWYNSNDKKLLFWLSRYSLAFKPIVILSSPISELSVATPVNTTDNEAWGRSSSLRFKTQILDAIIFLF